MARPCVSAPTLEPDWTGLHPHRLGFDESLQCGVFPTRTRERKTRPRPGTRLRHSAVTSPLPPSPAARDCTRPNRATIPSAVGPLAQERKKNKIKIITRNPEGTLAPVLIPGNGRSIFTPFTSNLSNGRLCLVHNSENTFMNLTCTTFICESKTSVYLTLSTHISSNEFQNIDT